MISFILKRLLISVVVIFMIITLSFFLVRFAKGGPFDLERSMPKEVKARLLARYGMDKPVLEQYVRYIGNLIQLDFGYSLKYQNRKIVEIISHNLPFSLLLGILALATAILTGIPLGLLAAKHQQKKTDKFIQALSIFFISIPTIITAPLLILLFALTLQLLPAGLWGSAKNLILPTIALATPFAARILLLTREKAVEITNAPFINAARGRGIPERKIFFSHILKNSLIPVTAYLAPGAAALLTGSVVVETIFVLPGLGKYFVQAAFNRDFTLIIGVIIVYSTILVLLNLCADIIIQYLDPRIGRSEEASHE